MTLSCFLWDSPMLSTLLGLVGFAVLLIGLLDLLLSDKQKKTLDTFAMKLWDEVDELRKLSFSERLTSPHINKAALGLSGIVAVPGIYNSFHEGNVSTVICGYLGFLISVWIGPNVLAWAGKGELRAWGVGIAAVAAVIGALVFNDTLGFTAFMMTAYYMLMRGVYLIVLYICAQCVSIVEYVLRRVAEYPKGAVAAVGVILTFASAFVKLVAGGGT